MRPQPTNIFLADDDCDDVLFFEYVLESICPNCQLTVASTGEELVGLLRDTNAMPDIVFVDVNMPILNGLEALEIIKGFPHMVGVPVIVYSTSFNDHDIQKAMECGASSYIVKPSDLDGLKKLIEKILSADWAALTPVKQEEFVLRG